MATASFPKIEKQRTLSRTARTAKENGSVLPFARVLIFCHWKTIHYQELLTAFLASLGRHKNLIERSGSPDSGFLVAVWANHSRRFSPLKDRLASWAFNLALDCSMSLLVPTNSSALWSTRMAHRSFASSTLWTISRSASSSCGE